jgi:hypothetical protein
MLIPIFCSTIVACRFPYILKFCLLLLIWTCYKDSVQSEHSHKHLGVILSQNAKWNEHLENMITNITKHLGILRKLKFSLNRSNLLKNNWSFLRYLRSDSVFQPVSAYKYSDFVKMGKPVTILAASN